MNVTFKTTVAIDYGEDFTDGKREMVLEDLIGGMNQAQINKWVAKSRYKSFLKQATLNATALDD